MLKEIEIKETINLITWWIAEIKANNYIGFYDINKVTEDLAMKLLNEIYDYQLENLNYEKNNYPGIDLGDKTNKIGFQITSRKDTRKIRESMEQFVKGPNEIYSNGIRFLILNQDNKPQLSKDKYQEIHSNFDPEKHILNADDLIEETRNIYDSDGEKFHRIKEVLEVEIGGKAIKKKDLKLLRSKLFNSSKAYYEMLTGPNGRFKHLDISDIILSHPKNEWINQSVSLEGEKENPKNIMESLPFLWKKKCKHSVILGEGGMGKTVSIIRLWAEYLEKKDKKTSVPIFIALNEYNQISDASKREDFIVSMIKKNNGDETVSKEAIWKIMKTPIQKGDDFIPSLILLLDGFNEITVDKRELLIEMKHLIEQARGVQLVITSRYDMRRNFNWTEFNLLKLLELEDRQVNSYFQEQGVLRPARETEGGGHRLWQLIKNPMMLTLYAAACEVRENYKDSPYCSFKERVETPGELLWNFMEAQVALLPERVGHDEKKIAYYKFLLKFFLPGLGFEMEKAGFFNFTQVQLNEKIDSLCNRFAGDDFFDTFFEFGKFGRILPIGDCSDDLSKRERREVLKEISCRELSMLVEEENKYRFLHHNFRDFFAAIHILNELQMGMNKGIPAVLKERTLGFFVRRFIGEIEGEHYCKPYLTDQGWKIDIKKNTILHRIMDKLRAKFGSELGYAVWNIVTIWEELRGELTGADLSVLDLSVISLNGIRCSRFYRDKSSYLAASMTGARIHKLCLFPYGHSLTVNSAIYSRDGEKILSTSLDQKIKEWDVATGQCIRTLTGHWDSFASAVYNPDGKKILSASHDHTIKEWDVGSGECIRTLTGHSSRVDSAVYNLDGKKILSASWDHTIKEWDVATGQCIHTLTGHSSIVNDAVYSPDDKKILSTSVDNTIKEWDVVTGECIRTLTGHWDTIASAVYSPDAKRILSASHDHTIKEWDVGSGECIRTLTGHSNRVDSAVYSRDGKKILSASWDNTIKEWNVDTGQCVQTLSGHLSGVTGVVYGPDMKKILSASIDKSIKEWDVATGECIQTLTGESDSIGSALFSPDGKRILSASRDHTIKEWDSATGQCIRTLTGHSGGVINAVYSRDGKKILSASGDGTIKEWDVSTGECLQTLEGHSNTVYSALYSWDGKKILSVSADHTINEWETATGLCIKKLEGHSAEVTSAIYSPDGKKILSASYDGTIKEWDTDTGLCKRTLTGHSEAVINAVYSPDGKKILSVSGDDTVKEWDVSTGECIQTLEGHSNTVYIAVYSRDGKKILSASIDNSIKEWGVATGECTGTWEEYEETAEEKRTEYAKYAGDQNNIAFWTGGNQIIFKDQEIVNIPGLWIQGCSFQNLEKGSTLSQWDLKMLKQYAAIVD